MSVKISVYVFALTHCVADLALGLTPTEEADVLRRAQKIAASSTEGSAFVSDE